MRKIIFCLCKDCDKQLWIFRSNIAILCAVQKGWKPLKRKKLQMGGEAPVVSVPLLLVLPNSSLTFTRQLPSGPHSVPTPWSCAPGGSLPFWDVSDVHAEHPPASHVKQLWDVAEKRRGKAVLCGRIFALWMTPDLGSWNWFPHTGFWFLCSLLLLHVAAVFLLSVHWIRMKKNGILLYFSSICPPTPPH